jgi:CRISPR-associated protein Csb2
MVRHALADLARLTRPFGWTDGNINTFVYGHTPDGTQPARGEHADQRFAFLPLPSLEQRDGRGTVAAAIRRVLVVGPPGREDAVAWARVLSGEVLTPLDERTQPAGLRLIDRPSASLRTDPNLGPYIGESTTWSTVTPVLRPGHDDGNVEKAEHLLRTAFLQAGFPAELVRTAELEWRASGFRAGVDLASRYELPPLKLPAYHVRVRWSVPVRGPFAVGAGRYRGLGVFAIEGDT